MAKVASNTQWTTIVYDLDGKPSECSLIDAKERVNTGRWSYAPPEVKAKEAETAPPQPEPVKEVKKVGSRSGGRNRKK